MSHAPTALPPDGAAISETPDHSLDLADKRILSLIQSGFPLAPRPYKVIGEAVGLNEAETFARVNTLREKGLIRRIGANFQAGKLGWHSTLCAANVPEEKLEEVIAAVNAEPGVTHNYLREHDYNLWFTMIGPSREAVDRRIDDLARAVGVAIINLPATRLYKIKVDFKLNEA